MLIGYPAPLAAGVFSAGKEVLTANLIKGRDMAYQLTLEDGQNALAQHAADKALRLREKYGRNIDYKTLRTILNDRDFVRYPTTIEFNSKALAQGFFAWARPVSQRPSDGFTLIVHEYFKDKPDDLPALVFYHLVTVNYGSLASHQEAENFGAAALGMEREAYYRLICRLTDQLPL